MSVEPINNEEIFQELVKNKLPDVPTQWKLSINDMRRMCKYINTSIFDKNECSLWNGYVENVNGVVYVNFFFNDKKIALHRLLYSNFVEPLESNLVNI